MRHVAIVYLPATIAFCMNAQSRSLTWQPPMLRPPGRENIWAVTADRWIGTSCLASIACHSAAVLLLYSLSCENCIFLTLCCKECIVGGNMSLRIPCKSDLTQCVFWVKCLGGPGKRAMVSSIGMWIKAATHAPWAECRGREQSFRLWTRGNTLLSS